MFIVKVSKEENLDRALKQFKNKVQKTGMIKELRDRQGYTKPSIARRTEVKNAIYRNKKYGNND